MHRTRTWNMDQPVLRGRNRVLPIEGGDGSTLSLDFTSMGSLDSRFTFTRASTATYINSSGLVTTMAAASTNDPTKARFDYDPTTLAPRGLLIEGAATNLLVYSQFTYTGSNPPTGWTSPFTGGPGSATASAFGSLDGSNAWTQTATANRPMLSSTAITLTSGNTYTASMYLESVSGGLTYQDVLLLNPSSATVGAPTYRRNGVVVNAADTAQPGRIEKSLSCTGNGNSNLRCGPGANASCTGSATFSRPQVEIGTAASSYIPTGASTVQRAADVCTMSGTNFSSWYGAPTAFTTVFEGAVVSQGGYNRILNFSSGVNTAGTIPNFNVGIPAAASNRPFINAYIVSSNNIDTYVPVGGVVTNGVAFKLAVRCQATLHRITRGTSLSASSSYNGFPSGLANLYLGGTDGAYQLATWYSKLKFFPIAISDSQMDVLAT